MSFVKKFDPTKKEDVEWLQKIDVSMSKATNQEMEWAESHFQLRMKFTQAVFRGVAYIPTQGTTD